MTDPIIAPPMKRCRLCGNEFPATVEYFQKAPSCTYGVSRTCKLCIRARRQLPENKAKKREYTREYRKRPEALAAKKASDAEYRSRPEVKAHHREYRREYDNRPDVQERIYEREHSDRVKARRKAYYSRPEIKERRQAYMSTYKPEYLKRPEPRLKHNINRKIQHAKRRAASGSFTRQDIEAIRKAQGGRCYICHKKLGKKYHVDHFIPVKLGGTNDPGNLRLACPHCNLSKNAKHPHELGILI